jgi:hypothetical protein
VNNHEYLHIIQKIELARDVAQIRLQADVSAPKFMTTKPCPTVISCINVDKVCFVLEYKNTLGIASFIVNMLCNPGVSTKECADYLIKE